MLAAALQGIDAFVFTAGIGEHDPAVRRDAVAGLEELGVVLDECRNLSRGRGQIARISKDGSPIAVLVVPTNEELAIARDCVSALS